MTRDRDRRVGVRRGPLGGADAPLGGPRDPPGKEAIHACRRCDLWKRATQGVAGEGSLRARLMLVGEQPGDQEDLQGRPFVGPAGLLLRTLLAEAGLAAADYYLTNAVKHFNWEPRGKRRIHKTPAQRDVAACSDWLEREIESIRPKVIVALGATALSALAGKGTSVGAARNTALRHSGGAHLLATYHPSALLRAPSAERKSELRRAVAEDLARAVRLLRHDQTEHGDAPSAALELQRHRGDVDVGDGRRAKPTCSDCNAPLSIATCALQTRHETRQRRKA
jgi:uracil-DNA glycosylase